MISKLLDPNRLFPADPSAREISRSLYEGIKNLPIISPHGHTDPVWFAENKCFTDATSLLLIPDHYLFRMLYSQGIPARHDVARRMDCRFLATLVAEGRLRLTEAEELSHDLAYNLAKSGYNLNHSD